MKELIIYIIMAAIGYAVGSRLRKHKEKIKWTSKVQTAAIMILVLTMGARMGANDEVISNLSAIGFYAFVTTIIVFVFSVAAVSITARLLKMDRYAGADKNKASDNSKGVGVDKMTVYIVIAVAAGMLCGYFFAEKLFSSFETFDSAAGLAINIGLCVLLWFVGLDLGLDGTAFGNIRKVGFKMLIFPVAITIASLLGAMVSGLIINMPLKEMAAVGAGLGWYSFAPGIIMEAGFVKASAISFMHNVMRELLAILIIPAVAKYIGFIETTALPGAAGMDVCLPIVEKATNANIAVYSFISGLVMSLLVPMLVPLIISL